MKKIKVLAEFECVVDLDLAIYKYIMDNFGDSDFIIDNTRYLETDEEIIELMINRETMNPLEVIIDGDCTEMYKDIIENKMYDLIQYARATDIFMLMVTYMKMLSDVDITILCENEMQANFIKYLNKDMKTFICKKEDVSSKLYDSLYLKFYASAIRYQNLNGKNIYIPSTKYNMEKTRNLNIMPKVEISLVTGYTNKIHIMDLYKNIKIKY